MGNIDFIDCPYRVKCNKASAKWQSRVGPNVSGVIGSAVVAGVLYTLCR